MEHDLDGLRILIVEDEAMLAFVFKTFLEDAGAEVAGPVNCVKSACDLLDEQEIDCAMMDVRLNNETVYPLADKLNARGIPFIFVTGNSANILPPEYSSRPLLLKPVGSKRLVFTIARLTHTGAGLMTAYPAA